MEFYTLFRAEYNKDGYTIFIPICVYDCIYKCTEDVKYIFCSGIREPCHPDMHEMNRYTIISKRNKCYSSCLYVGESILAGYIIEITKERFQNHTHTIL